MTGAAGQLTALRNAVQGVGPGTSLSDRITAAQSFLAAGNTAGACTQLTYFINDVRAQTGKAIPRSAAINPIRAATQIRDVLGC